MLVDGGSTRWVECAQRARRLAEADPQGDHRFYPGMWVPRTEYGLHLTTLLLFLSPPQPDDATADRDRVDAELLELVAAAADAPPHIGWSQRSELQREPLEKLLAELARRLRAAGFDLDLTDPHPDPEVRAWRMLDATPQPAGILWTKEPYCSMTESHWDEPGQTSAGHAALKAHRWLELSGANA